MPKSNLLNTVSNSLPTLGDDVRFVSTDPTLPVVTANPITGVIVDPIPGTTVTQPFRVVNADPLHPASLDKLIVPVISAEQILTIGSLTSVVPTTKLLAATGLGTTPISQSGNLSTLKTSDVYSFGITGGSNIDGTGNINLSLHNISAGDDADLLLYRDSNYNGVLDGSDTQIVGSFRSSNLDDSINVRATAGNYFAKVQRYDFGSSGDVQYKLDLSSANPSNLFPKEDSLGKLSSGSNRTRSGSINNDNTADIYGFSQGYFKKTKISLSGLSNDADIRVIKDKNNNQIFDRGDVVVGTSTRGDSASESITVKGSGSYIAEVYQYNGDTGYTLGMKTSNSFNSPF